MLNLRPVPLQCSGDKDRGISLGGLVFVIGILTQFLGLREILGQFCDKLLLFPGWRAVIREDGWTLEYGDLCLDAGTLTEEAVSPATALARIMYALREGWLLEQNDESREGVPCTRLALDQTGASDTDIVTTVWLRQADGTPFLGEIAVDGETILTVRFTAFGFCDTITDNS